MWGKFQGRIFKFFNISEILAHIKFIIIVS